jgi:hypothetical protein
LTPASRRQNHTTSPSASHAVRQRHISVHCIPSRVRDDRERPWVGRDGAVMDLIWGKPEEIYFFKWGWTSDPSNHLSGKSLSVPE